ncbi:MAG TPA: hypothetical protein VFB66_15530 [Tepidisphaeraceae bacterium]|nr:hypothetical protein [Tepidisphaeraceae bacterium]
MKHRLHHLLTLLSLLTSIAVAGLWVRSYRVSSIFGYYTNRGSDGWYRNNYFVSYRGRLTLVMLRESTDHGLFQKGRFHARDDPDPSYGQNPEFAGFGYLRVPRGDSMRWTELQVPHWSLLLVAGIAPTCSVVRKIRRRRQLNAGLCPRCGYDLRATPQRCPECGTVAAEAGDAHVA